MLTMNPDRTIPTSEPLPLETRERLMEAAGEMFAEFGFHKTTIRNICHRAKANVAAINYYFGDKERLYSQVLLYGQRRTIEKYPLDMGLPSDATPQERLHAMIRAFLLRILDLEQSAWHGRLLAKEMSDPGPTLDLLVEQNIRPQFQRVVGMVRDILGPNVDEMQVRDSVRSIIGQCLFYHFARHTLAKLDPAAVATPERIEQLARHITQFSLAGLEAIRAAHTSPAVTCAPVAEDDSTSHPTMEGTSCSA